MSIRWSYKIVSRVFHREVSAYTGHNFVPSINTRSTVVKLVKLMAWRQAKSLMNIPVCKLLGYLWRHPWPTRSGGNLWRWFCLPASHQIDCFHHRGSCFYRWQKVFASTVVSVTIGCPMEQPIVDSHLVLFSCLFSFILTNKTIMIHCSLCVVFFIFLINVNKVHLKWKGIAIKCMFWPTVTRVSPMEM